MSFIKCINNNYYFRYDAIGSMARFNLESETIKSYKVAYKFKVLNIIYAEETNKFNIKGGFICL